MTDKGTALITGSYGGLGTCFTDIHAASGGGLILVGRSQRKLEEQAEKVGREYGVQVHTIAADLSDPSAAAMIYDTCKSHGWTVNYLINNVGFGGQGISPGKDHGAGHVHDRGEHRDPHTTVQTLPSRFHRQGKREDPECVFHSRHHARAAAGGVLRDQGLCHQLVERLME